MVFFRTALTAMGLARTVMTLVADDRTAVEGKRSEAQEQQRLEMEKLLIGLSATAQEESTHAQEALDTARAAAKGVTVIAPLHPPQPMVVHYFPQQISSSRVLT